MSRGALHRWLRQSLTACASVGLLIRFTVKDRWPVADLLFYALPLPVIACLLLAAGALSPRRGSLVGRVACFGGSAVLAGLWLTQNFFHHPCRQAASDFRVLEWNLGHGRGGWDPMVAAIRREEATVIGLVEAQTRGPNPVRFWRAKFPDHEVRAPGKGLILLVKGEIESIRSEEFGIRSRVSVAEVKIGGRPLRVVLVDLEANWLSRREPLIERVRAAAEAPAGRPVLILGDFNTPGDSVWFDRLRRDYDNVFEVAGEGIAGTWPFHLPLLALDHLWTSKALRPVCAGKSVGRLSDHARVWAEIAITDTSGEEGGSAESFRR